MPSSNKTTNLSLNNWESTDKPKMADFNSDNSIIDQVVGTHISDSSKHLSTADRTLLEDYVVKGSFTGTGSPNGNISLSFNPKAVFVYMKGKPFIEYDATNGYTLCNSALVTASGASAGISLSGKIITVSQSQSDATDGVFLNLYKNNTQYAYIALR